MTYAVRVDLEDRFGTTEIGELAALDPDAVTRALDDTDALIDAHLAGRYALPLVSTPKVLLTTACDLARYKLYVGEAPEEVRNRNRDALKLLEAIRDGKLQLGLSPNEPAAAVASAPVLYEAGISNLDLSGY